LIVRKRINKTNPSNNFNLKSFLLHFYILLYKKTDALRAVIRGKYVNIIIMDEATSTDLVKKDPPRLL
jgi:hypothetical protein